MISEDGLHAGARVAGDTSSPPPAGLEVSVEALDVRFGEGRKAVDAVTDATFKVGVGEVVCLLGPSGCGKSTILNVVAGLLSPHRGRVLVGGDEVVAVDRRVGYMFQHDALIPWLTAIQNVLLPMDVIRRPDRARAQELLDLVQLTGFENHRPYQLSGGMRKRVQLARLLAQDPEVLLLDEPFGALDAQTRLLIQGEFLRIWERQARPTIFVTHDLAEAIVMGDRILVMSRRPGRIKSEYSVDLPRPRSISALMGSPRYQELFQELWESLREEVESTVVGTAGTR